jgi:endonuclease YncB( thermonuclease family)
MPRPTFSLTLLFFTLFVSCRPLFKEELPGVRMQAVRIIDGDTFEGLSEGVTYRIRLDAIDAPERGQPFYRRSKEMLGQLCMDAPLRVELLSKDRYGRWIGRVFDRKEQDVNALMISEGMAWHYLKYSSDENLTGLESAARSGRIGLWSDPAPVAPWIYRHEMRKPKIR